MAPTATGGTVAGVKAKAMGLDPPWTAPTMAVLEAVVLAVTDCVLVKLFAVLSCGTTAGSIASVPEVVIGPPVRPKPLPTFVTVPPPPTDAQTHAAPFHCNTCPLPQVLIKLRSAAPDVAPPINPLPAAVFTALIVPPPPAVAWTEPSGNMKPPVVLWIIPVTLNFCVGVPVPIPKLPPLDITTDLLATAAPFSYRKNPNVSNTNADCCNSQKLFGKFVSSNRITGAELRMCSFRCGVPVPIPRFPALLTTNDLSATAAPFSYRKNPNVSNTNADCCNSQKLFGKFVSSNRIVGAALFRCSVLAGLLVPIPTFVPVSKIEEFTTLAPVASNLATKFCVPPPPIVAAPMAPVLGNTAPTPVPLPDEGLASTNDDSGFPPNVSASAAFNAYGTLTNNTRGCSSSFGRFTCTPSQRGSPAVNSSRGNPSFLVEPSSTVYLPCSSNSAFCVSSHSADPPSCSL